MGAYLFFLPHYNIYSLMCINFSKNDKQMHLNLLTYLIIYLLTYLLLTLLTYLLS